MIVKFLIHVRFPQPSLFVIWLLSWSNAWVIDEPRFPVIYITLLQLSHWGCGKLFSWDSSENWFQKIGEEKAHNSTNWRVSMQFKIFTFLPTRWLFTSNCVVLRKYKYYVTEKIVSIFRFTNYDDIFSFVYWKRANYCN